MGRTLLYGFIGVLFAVVQWQKCAQREQECVSIMLFGLRPSQPKCHMHRPRRPPKLPHLWPPKLLHLAGVS